MTVLQFALLGLGLGGVYALLGNGLVLIYRGSGVLNFAHGAYAMVSAYVFWELHDNHHWSFAAAFVAAVGSVGMLGAVTHLVVMRRLRQASPLARLIATLGILTLLQGVATVRYKGGLVQVATSLPHRALNLSSTLVIPEDQVIMLGIAAGLAIALTYLSRYTTLGVVTTAVAENRRAAAALGWSPDVIATVTWSVGTALAGVAGILIVPLSGLNASQLTLVVIAAMAAALAAGFSSFLWTLCAGVAIGIVQSLMAQYVTQTGASDAVPFIVIMVVLVIRGRSLPIRREVLERLPRVGTGIMRPKVFVPVAVLLAVLMLTAFPVALNVAITVQLVVAVILLSIVVITGYAGQLSLAQYGLAGLGGYFSGRLVSAAHWPFAAALVVGVVGAAAIGAIFGIPALRTRGVNLAVVTLGLGFAIEVMLFNNSSYTGGLSGTSVGAASFLGINIDPVTHAGRYGVFCLVCFVIAAVAVANLRRGRAGRSLIAVRANERAAASVGVSVMRTKLVAFAISSGIAGLGGVLLAFQSHIVIFSSYDLFSSVNAVSYATIGGVGFLAGPLLGSGLAPGGIGSWILDKFGTLDLWLPVIGGASVLLILMQNPDGLAGAIAQGDDPLTGPLVRRLRARQTGRNQGQPLATLLADPSAEWERAEERQLEITDLSVRYGAVVAVSEVSLSVRPGEVLGLIGPNGAGKTTIIDAVTGFTRPSTGSIRLGSVPLNGLAPAARTTAGLARSFQSVELFDDLTVLENIQAASDKRDFLAYVTNLVRPGRDPLNAAASAAVREFGLESRLESYPSELPHGVRRLVGIARAVATRPSVLLLDEPAAGLDSQESAELGSLLRRLAHDWGIGILLVEHDMDMVMNVCDRIVVIDFGRRIAQGTPAEIRKDPGVIAAYLGRPTKVDGGSIAVVAPTNGKVDSTRPNPLVARTDEA